MSFGPVLANFNFLSHLGAKGRGSIKHNSSIDYSQNSQNMVKRPHRILHSLYAKRRARPTSPADGPGFIYAFIDKGSRFKIGMTRNFDRRRTQWDRQCPSNRRRWMPPLAVQRRRRAEPLSHLLLELKCSDRPRTRCSHCHKNHNEIFTFNAKGSKAWRTIVHPLLLKAARV
ncbi:hypothetical protein F5880DRAFT_1734952 [Lentinula raphanica]|nr:hypothetical protein F5880DRAFT_1734952 [Lentinula raphanica]